MAEQAVGVGGEVAGARGRGADRGAARAGLEVQRADVERAVRPEGQRGRAPAGCRSTAPWSARSRPCLDLHDVVAGRVGDVEGAAPLGQAVGIGVGSLAVRVVGALEAPRRHRWRSRRRHPRAGAPGRAGPPPRPGGRTHAGAGGDAVELLAPEGQRVDADDLALAGQPTENSPVCTRSASRARYLVTEPVKPKQVLRAVDAGVAAGAGLGDVHGVVRDRRSAVGLFR